MTKEKRNEYMKRYREANKERKKEADKLYRERHRDKINERNKDWRNKNKDTINEKNKEYRELNKDKITEYLEKTKTKRNNVKSEYYSANKSRINELRKLNYHKDKEKKLEYQQKYAIENKEKVNEYRREYDKKRRLLDPLYRIKCNLRSMIRNSIKNLGYKKTSRTHEILGCSYEDFKTHIESQWESWMTWENYGLYNGELNYGWDIDHIIPQSSAKTEFQLHGLNHHTNLRPLCSKVNRDIKRDKNQGFL